MKLGLAQMTSTDDVQANLRQMIDLYSRAADQGSDLVVFPENSLYFRLQPGAKLMSLSVDSPEIQRLRELVERRNAGLMLTTAMDGTGGKARNSTLLLDRGQAPRIVYSKIHLFDVDVDGAPSVRESDHFLNGEGPATVSFRGWEIGLSICYDLRFAELYLRYAHEVDLILVPSAFLVPTGQAHWHVLLRARAIEGQCFVAAPAQSGEHRSLNGTIRKTYGHSLAVDPWGRVLAEVLDAPAVQVVELAKELIAKVRQQIPMKKHRRL
ncbi:MAG TPA: nitrilase-related carbon-nitrogen hydrolase [Bdellovibrionales bacterium]|nr:nitrilase-related carbon-nitrogen hydrolase [Bdellovibrionales bacterium]